ncbi:DUF3102 domain-containing protein [Dysosmobacter sp.]|uniref:DUF3102 domain-containing protein n=1 Tax=Dysosmobacter sp. TaxID=2591382 RepID=UPI003AB3955D
MSLEQAKILAAELGLEEPPGVDPMEAAYRMTDAYYREQMEARTSGSPREDDGEGAILARDFGMNGQPPAEDRPLDLLTEEILFYKRQAGGAIIEIGKRLLEAKAQLGHGEWLPWLREKVDISERSAQNFMRLAREYSKSADIADLGASKALALLALPESERADFAAETHTVNGVEKTASEMTARELREAIQARDRALLEAREADARAKSAEESRVKMEADMRQLKELQQRAREAEEEKGRQLQAAEAELQALRSRPVEVAVETRDAAPEQLASAREEGARQAREEAAKSHRRDLEEAERKARDNVKKLREELKRAQSESREANLRMQAAEKKAADAARLAKASANENMVTFRVLFESAQDTVNRMADAVGKEGAENQRKMRAALRALAQAIEKAAGA